MPLTFAEESQTVSTTEWSLPRDASYDSGQVQTTVCILQIWIDTANLVAGDEYEVRLYEKVKSGGTARSTIIGALIGAQAEPWISPSLIVGNGWDVTLKRISSTTDRAFDWSLRKVT